jgi:lysozyme
MKPTYHPRPANMRAFATIARGVSFAAALLAATGCVSSRFPTIDTLPPGILAETPEGGASGSRGVVRTIDAPGLQITETSEGFVDHLYDDAARYCTVGYGHLVKKAPCDGSEPRTFVPTITRAYGAELLQADMVAAEVAVAKVVPGDLTDGQFSALCDFVFNVGAENFDRSTLLKRVNTHQFALVPEEFRRWTIAGGKELPGLEIRREQEISLFFLGLSIPEAGRGVKPPPIDILVGEGQ